VSIDSEGNIGTKILVDVVSEWISGYKYDIITDKTFNYVAEDLLSVTHTLVAGSNTFDFGDNLIIDQEKMQADIEKYGLYTYEEWAPYCDYETFVKYQMPIYKVGVAKGLYTVEFILEVFETYLYNDSILT
jgi:hypothetical protein